MSFHETPEYAELKTRWDAEYAELVNKKHTRRDMRRMAVRHVNEFMRNMKKWAKKEVTK